MTQSAETRRTLHIHVGCCRAFRQIGTICLAFVLSIFSTLSFADNAVTGSGTECVYSTLNTYTGPSTIKANWDPNTINLYWYNDDTQTSSNTCNYDGSISLPATNPTKTGYTFAGWEVVGGVPTGYTQLEWLRSDGHSYINTGYSPTSSTLAEIDVKVDSGAGNVNIFGSAVSNSDGGSSYALLVFNVMSNTQYEIKFGSSWINVNSNPLARNIVSISATAFTVNGVVLQTNSGTISNSGNKPFYLFQRWRPTISSCSTKIQVYRFSIYENGVLVQNLIPAKRNSDSVVGMWDTVSGTFKTNAGSGTFTAGPAVQ